MTVAFAGGRRRRGDGSWDDMLIQDFVRIKAPFASVRERLLEPRPLWLYDSARQAYAEGERLLLTVSPVIGVPRIGKHVEVEVGRPYRRGEGCVAPISWWATGAQRLFPTLDADLEVMPLGPDEVMLTLMGRYEPPLGPLGRSLDPLVLHRVAEACIRSFLHRAASGVEDRPAA